MSTTHVSEGDTLSLTITGKVVTPGTPGATTLRVNRTGGPDGVRVEAVLAADAKVGYEVTSRWKNGVHLDDTGTYWMRKPDGWYRMSTSITKAGNLTGPWTPPGAHRLREDKE